MQSPDPISISQAALRDLQAELFKTQTRVLGELIASGITPARIAFAADLAQVLQTVQQLRPPTR